MTRIICRSMEGGMLDSINYQGASGTRYTFFKGRPTEVNDQKDVDEFLAAGNGKFFEKESVINKIVEKIMPKAPEVPSPPREAPIQTPKIETPKEVKKEFKKKK